MRHQRPDSPPTKGIGARLAALAGLALIGIAIGFPAHAQDAASRMRLMSSGNPSLVGAPIALRAEVDGIGGGRRAPSGLVTFRNDAALLGQRALRVRGAGQTTLALAATHSCAINQYGGALCWGRNDHGQIGDGSTFDWPNPKNVFGLVDNVSAITTGVSHSCALTMTGAARCWGDNDSGKLGDGTTTNRLKPVAVVGLVRDVIAIAAGSSHSCAVTGASGVKCWGLNHFGQLGDGSTATRLTPTNVSGLTSGVAAVSAGGVYFTCALTTAGRVKCWGANGYGQLGDGTKAGRLAPVDVGGLTGGVAAISASAGGAHACALTRTGAVKCWGYNSNGQLGDGTKTDRATPVDVVGLSSGVVAISAGRNHSCALTSSGAVKCWGSGAFVGDGSTTDRLTPVDVTGLTRSAVAIMAGYDHSCAATILGALKCWGANQFRQLGDGTTTFRPTPVIVNVTPLARASAVFGTRPLQAGDRAMSAEFSGDANYLGSTGALTQRVR